MSIYVQGDGGHARVIKELLDSYKGPQTEEKLAIVAVGDNRVRKKEAERLEAEGYKFVVLWHPNVNVAPSAEIGMGTVLMAGVTVQTGARIGKHVILNTGCSVDHDCVVEDYAHIAPGARLCGHVKVGEGSLVGVGVGVAPKAVIPPWSLVKARRLEIEPLPSN